MGLPFDGRLLLHFLFSRFSAFLPRPPSPFLSDSCALFCNHQNLNSFVFKRFRSLCATQPAWGEYTPGRCLRSTVGQQKTRLSDSLPVRRECIERTIGTGGPLRQAIPRSRFRRFQLRGRVRWVSFLVVGSSSSRASPFFVPTNN